MAWKDLSIGAKLGIGFGSLLLLIVIGGFVGYSGLKSVDRSLVVISDEEAPLVDVSMEMKVALLQAMISMEEYLGATAVVASGNGSELGEIIARYQSATELFDQGVNAILNGGQLGDIAVIKTDNAELAGHVRSAAELHDKSYDATARELIDDGRMLLATKQDELAAMADLEKVVEAITAEAEQLEGEISQRVQRKVRANNVGAAGQAILREEMPQVDMAMEMKYVIAKTRIVMEEFAQAIDSAEMDELEREYRTMLAAFDRMAAAVLHGGVVDGVQVIASNDSELRTMVTALAASHGRFEKAAEKMMQARRKMLAQTEEAEETMARLDSAGEKAAALLAQVETLASSEMAAAKANGSQSSSNAIFWQLIVVFCSLFVGGLLGFIISRSLSRPINRGVALADEIAKGDFSQRLNLERQDEVGRLALALDRMADSLQQKACLAETVAGGNLDVTVELASEKDQLGLALKKMTDSLNEIIGQIDVASEQIATGGGQVSDAAQTLSQGATESAASLEEITSSMNEMSSKIGTNAESAAKADSLSKEVMAAAEKGSVQMGSMVAAIEEINEAGHDISRIIKTIDEIAFQTNLLALNAAVEAARAGQHGKGFAVVAEEVRNLAARSAKAAEETTVLIQGTVAKTANGSEIASETAAALQDIVSGIGHVSRLVNEIATDSNGQAQGISMVDQGLTQIDKVTQQNTASAEESAAAAEQLSGQAEQLRQMVGRFKLRPCDSSLHLHPPVSPMEKIRWPELEKEAARSVQGSVAAIPPAIRIALDSEEFGRY